jgi:hypothetical protein
VVHALLFKSQLTERRRAMMLKPILNKVSTPMILLGLALAAPAFAQTGVPHSIENTTNPNAQNATNLDAQVPPAAPGTAVGGAQPAVPQQGSDAAIMNGRAAEVAVV